MWRELKKFLFSLILNGSSIFREATSPFDRATMFCGDFSLLIFLLLFLFLWEKMGGEKQTHTHTNCTPPPHTGHVQLWTLEGCGYLLFIDLLSTGSLSLSFHFGRKITDTKISTSRMLERVRSSTGGVGVFGGGGDPGAVNVPIYPISSSSDYLSGVCVCVCVCKFLFLNLFLGIFQHAPLRLVPSPHTHTRPSWKKSLFKNSLEG
jgi:hypothetical protein